MSLSGIPCNNAYELIVTKIESRSFSSKPVPVEIEKKILETARLTGSGNNIQHWKFVLIQDKENIKKLHLTAYQANGLQTQILQL